MNAVVYNPCIIYTTLIIHIVVVVLYFKWRHVTNNCFILFSLDVCRGAEHHCCLCSSADGHPAQPFPYHTNKADSVNTICEEMVAIFHHIQLIMCTGSWLPAWLLPLISWPTCQLITMLHFCDIFHAKKKKYPVFPADSSGDIETIKPNITHIATK